MGNFLAALANNVAGGVILALLGFFWSRTSRSTLAKRMAEALFTRRSPGNQPDAQSAMCPWHARPINADELEGAPTPIPKRKRPLLRACLDLDPDYVRCLGRVPLEFNLVGSKPRLALVLMRALMLRPSSAKPFFVAQSVRQRRATGSNSTPWDFPLGGHELRLRLRTGEDHRHLRRSLGRGSDAWKQLTVLADVGDLVACNPQLKCFVTNAHATDRNPNPKGELVLRSSDPLLAGRGPYVSLPCWSIPRDALWIVDSHVKGDDPTPNDSAREQAAGMPLDPRLLRLPRMLLYWSIVLVFGVAVLITLLFGRSFDATSVASIASSLSIASVLWLIYCGVHSVRYLTHELRHWRPWQRFWRLEPKFWIARTTRCFADGDRIRSGHSIDRGRKYS